jgi:hypothetical protein
MKQQLKAGDFIRCPHCRRWHPVVKWHTQGTAYTVRMLYLRCNGQMFYAGQEGLESRHETRHLTPAEESDRESREPAARSGQGPSSCSYPSIR